MTVTLTEHSRCDDLPTASIIVTCKGRLHHLRITLANLMSQRWSRRYEVIVVDYGCPDGTFEWCSFLDLKGLVAVRINDDTEEFHRSRAKNCGANIARGCVLGFVDADIRLHERWLHFVAEPILAGTSGICTCAFLKAGAWDRGGTCAVASELFHSVRGYDEQLTGWGSEDSDFYSRCIAISKSTKYQPSLLAPICHDHATRVRFHNVKDIGKSNRLNRAYLRNRRGQVNADGYGVSEFSVSRGSGEKTLPFHWTSRVRLRPKIRRPHRLHC